MYVLFGKDRYVEVMKTDQDIALIEEYTGALGEKDISNIKKIFISDEHKEFYIGNQLEVYIGNNGFCHINTFQKEDLLIKISAGTMEVLMGEVYVNGRKYKDKLYTLTEGDCILTGNIYISYNIDIISIRGNEYQSNLSIPLLDKTVLSDNYPLYKKPPRIIKRITNEVVDIRKPEPKEEKAKGELLKRIAMPFATLMMTIAVSIILKRGIYVLISGGTMVITIIFSITTGIQAAKDRKEKERNRIIRYENYLLRQRKKLYQLYYGQSDALRYHYPNLKDIVSMTENLSGRIYERDPDESDFYC